VVLVGAEHYSPALLSLHCHHTVPNLHTPHEKHLLYNVLSLLLFHHGKQLKRNITFNHADAVVNSKTNVGFEVFMAVAMKNAVFWDVAPLKVN
jgi:hypothetical protein